MGLTWHKQKALTGGIGQYRTKNAKPGGPQPALKDANCTPFPRHTSDLQLPFRLTYYSSINLKICSRLRCSVVSSCGPCLAQVQNCFVDLGVCPVAANVVQVIIKIHECFVGAAVQE